MDTNSRDDAADFLPNLRRAAAFAGDGREHVYMDMLEHGGLVAIGASESATLVVPLPTVQTLKPVTPVVLDTATVNGFSMVVEPGSQESATVMRHPDSGALHVMHGGAAVATLVTHDVPFYETWREDTEYDDLDNVVVVKRQELLDIVSFLVEMEAQTVTLDALSERVSVFGDGGKGLTSIEYSVPPVHHVRAGVRPRRRPSPRALTRVGAEPLRAVLDTMTGRDVSLRISEPGAALLVRDVNGVLGVVRLTLPQEEKAPDQ